MAFGSGIAGSGLRRRIEHARQLLQDTDLGVSEVAQKVGFKDDTALSRHMRRLVGVTAREFRRTCR